MFLRALRYASNTLSRPVLSRRALFLIPLVFLVWANCHATFVMGFVLYKAFRGRMFDFSGGVWQTTDGGQTWQRWGDDRDANATAWAGA